nr:hypothetical protein [Tanacetum cinerariifolium]
MEEFKKKIGQDYACLSWMSIFEEGVVNQSGSVETQGASSSVGHRSFVSVHPFSTAGTNACAQSHPVGAACQGKNVQAYRCTNARNRALNTASQRGANAHALQSTSSYSVASSGENSTNESGCEMTVTIRDDRYWHAMSGDNFFDVQSCESFHTICCSGRDEMCEFVLILELHKAVKKLSLGLRPRYTSCFSSKFIQLSIVSAFMKELIGKMHRLHVSLLELSRFEIPLGELEIISSSWPFVFTIPDHVSHLVASITLDSARSCMMQVVGDGVMVVVVVESSSVDRASSVKVPVANFTLQSSIQLLRENTDSVRSKQRMSLTAPSEPLKLKGRANDEYGELETSYEEVEGVCGGLFVEHRDFCSSQDESRRDHGWFDNANSIVIHRQTKNLIDINIDSLYNILKQNQGDVNYALGYKKKAVVVTLDPLALVAEKMKVSKRKEKVVVSSDSEGSGADDFS